MKKLKIPVKFVLSLLLFFFLVSSASGEEAKVHIVKIEDFNYFPPELIMYEGETVLWINEMPYGHWAISGSDMKHDGRFFSPLLLKDHEFSYTFEEAVVQDYYCPIHSMQGRITVLEKKKEEGEKEKEVKKEKKTRRRRKRKE